MNKGTVRHPLRYALIGAAVILLLFAVLGGLRLYQTWKADQELVTHYQSGAAALEAGEYDTAIAEFAWVAERAPDYQGIQAQLADAQAQLADAQAQQAIAQTQAQYDSQFEQARAYSDQQQWASAIPILEDLRSQAPDYRPEAIKGLLFAAHSSLGRALAADGQFDEAVYRFGAALALLPDSQVEQEKELASAYPLGTAALERGECARAEEMLRGVYEVDPNYHEVADQLYAAGTCACQELIDQHRLDEAEAQCQVALQAKPQGKEAIQALALIAYLRTPTPTATFTPSPTPTSTLTPSATSTPTPGAVKKPATVTCRKAQKGLIGFSRANRCDAKTGADCAPYEIWVMNPDGSNQAPMCNTQAYSWGLERDHTANDGTWDVRVSPQKADIIRLYLGTNRQEMIIANNGKDWDPALSADNWWLAWCTNRNGNDEIYIKSLDPKDQNQRRLTINAWEWDKHPTWSPDGRSIAFYSNRANKLSEATRQIWVMDIVNDKGANLRNISNRPDKVDTNPVWFKWDGIPQ